MRRISLCLLAAALMSAQSAPAAEQGLAGGEGVLLPGSGEAGPSGVGRKALVRELERLRRSGKTADERVVLAGLVRRGLLYQAARDAGVRADAVALEKELAAFKARFTSPAAFARELAALDLTEAELRDEVRRGMVVQAFVQQRFAAAVNPSEQELRAWYQAHPEVFQAPARVRAGHILVRKSPDEEAQGRQRAREKIAMVQERLNKGEDFGALARQFSECYSADQGGDLGYFRADQMQEAFSVAAFALAPGQTSAVVETADGYHLIRVAAVEPAGAIDFDRARDEVVRRLRAEQTRDAAVRYADRLRGEIPFEQYVRDN